MDRFPRAAVDEPESDRLLAARVDGVHSDAQDRVMSIPAG